MKSLLENLNYVLDPQRQIWSQPGYAGISYSDGDEAELRIANIVEQAYDVTVLSSELRQHCTDWPSLYHLSAARANILRPFAEVITGDILEIGAGCGAITRYLGECGANVLALEGSPRRAAIARSRTRDLENVTVVAEKFDLFRCERKFDVITLIGVLEYANLFTPAENPPMAMLQRVRSLLKPDGKLIIAIENQMGLKYFAGAPEDHLGQPMYGIEGRYKKDQPQTFGRRVLTTLIEQAGFAESEFLAPLPDYKLPVSILTEAGIKNNEFDAAAFAWQSARRDPQLPAYCTFSQELAWPEIFKNGLGLETANSFLIVASPSRSVVPLHPEALAYHYSTDRLPQYCKETLFRSDSKNKILISYRSLAGAIPPDANSVLFFTIPEETQYTKGSILSRDFIQIVSRDGWTWSEVGAFVKSYVLLLVELASQAGHKISEFDPESQLPGEFFDVIPQNIIIKNDGAAIIIDREWRANGNVTLGWLLFRSLLSMVGGVTRFGSSPDGKSFSLREFVRLAIESAGIHITNEAIERIIEKECDITLKVTGRPLDESLRMALEQPLPIHHLRHALSDRDQQIVSLTQNVENLTQNVENLTQTVHNLTAQRDNILKSTSWRITKPLRSFRKKGINKPYYLFRKSLSASAKQIWKQLPLPFEKKLAFKNRLFNTVPFLFHWSEAYRNWAAMNGIVDSDSISHLSVNSHTTHRPGAEVDVRVQLLHAAPLENAPAKLIAFYLPQFHPIPENNVWWGEGFTEWSNVRPAQPQFIGHYQPHVPDELGYYNLLDTRAQHRQIELAKLYGVGGFCFYTYWFGGKLLLQKPVQNYLNDQSLALPFCLCWANENWSRRWDGLDSEILIAQDHSPEDDLGFIQYISQYMRDERYIRVNGKPLLLVYRPSLLPSAKNTAVRWREWCRENNIGEIFLAYTQSFENVDPALYGFDAAIEFPPNNSSPPNITAQVKPLSADFRGTVYDWRIFVERSYKYRTPAYKLFRGVCPSWDNTARRKNKGTIFLNSSPQGYQEWLFNAINETKKTFNNPDEQLIFVNAWNEWAEGAHLEPDQRYGYAYLEATRMALIRSDLKTKSEKDSCDSNAPIAIIIHAFYVEVFDEILTYIDRIHRKKLKLYVSAPVEIAPVINERLLSSGQNFFLLPVKNHGRDVLPMLKMLPEVIKANHAFVLKVHTKKSLHRCDGDQWRRELFNGLLNEESIVETLDQFGKNPRLGVVAPKEHIVPLTYYWSSNGNRVIKLASRLGISESVLSDMNFVAGTMFMARTTALVPLLNLAIKDEDFEEESGQTDGTMAHAIERIIGVCAHSAGYVLSNGTTVRYKFAA
ncbi:glycoside hydrolase family 99-like domain-containing protein [Oxalobacteraceae bacterium R-40]|uniref:Glycoside hydrolase family 99-like domain-containing protein n=1 Tax=Keguizhuia sedimenti TaxID=3064264 RepID=A0ABU1BMK3_9BURK|nr:glycoside hydrolase family 99-like domain-containing protein [Oxalobacteraceae bacterium R-40]